jgi:hypothetical protein
MSTRPLLLLLPPPGEDEEELGGSGQSVQARAAKRAREVCLSCFLSPVVPGARAHPRNSGGEVNPPPPSFLLPLQQQPELTICRMQPALLAVAIAQERRVAAAAAAAAAAGSRGKKLHERRLRQKGGKGSAEAEVACGCARPSLPRHRPARRRSATQVFCSASWLDHQHLLPAKGFLG